MIDRNEKQAYNRSMDGYRVVGKILIGTLAAIGAVTVVSLSCASHEANKPTEAAEVAPPAPADVPAETPDSATPTQPNGGAVHVTDDQASDIHIGEGQPYILTTLGNPDYEKSSEITGNDPHKLDDLEYNLPNHHSLSILTGDAVARSVTIFDDQENRLHYEEDKNWEQMLDYELAHGMVNP